jgi:nucleotide-binding universal stress UspA family protein
MNTLDAVDARAEMDLRWIGPVGETREGLKAETLLVALSDLARAGAVLMAAVALAREKGGRLVILHAVELNIPGEERGIARGEMLRELMSAAESNIGSLAEALCGDVPFIVIVREGPASAAILRTAHRCGARAIVLGQRRSGWLTWLRRDNLRAIVQNASQPVYLVASDQAQADQRSRMEAWEFLKPADLRQRKLQVVARV